MPNSKGILFVVFIFNEIVVNFENLLEFVPMIFQQFPWRIFEWTVPWLHRTGQR